MNKKLFSIGLACLIALFLIPHFGHAQNTRPIVRLIYFLPKDRKPQPNIEAKFDKWIKGAQLLYANQMEAHGFGRKTFQFETDANGNAVVHHFVGQFTDAHYSSLSSTWDIWGEIDKQFDASKNIYVTVIDMSSEYINLGRAGGHGGNWGSSGGKVLTTIVPNTEGIIKHELAHAFGLFHDYATSNAKRVSTFVEDMMINSFCAAEWLDAHLAFNPSQSTENEPTKIQMLPPSFASPPDAIRLRFEIRDPNGIHQVQLLAPIPLYHGDLSLLGCKYLNGNISGTIEFVTNDLTPKTRYVMLQAIDGHGNLTLLQQFPIDVTSIIPPPQTISIPDPQLAAAVQREIGNITTHAILNLQRLDASNSGITDLTGIEYASNLMELYLQGNVNTNTVLDLQPLSGLTNLNRLDLSDNNITDISALSALKNLTSHLALSGNNITDVSALSEMTNLISLNLGGNNISDISALTTLKNLTNLKIWDNNITDISALSEMTNPHILYGLNLDGNNISDISALSALKNLTSLRLSGNNITDASALSEMTNLISLNLGGNNISDISPLATLTYLNEL
ncbi:MAG: leucine-rich repeat domain-containing protein, partial [Candidatus Poribacteria bacterium]|nr:leucine-rich repeat domain-containing protein [Candidatus Poribacteria bacterium]